MIRLREYFVCKKSAQGFGAEADLRGMGGSEEAIIGDISIVKEAGIN